jgi:hypothetical protein
MTPDSKAWPALPLDAWRPTCDTLHLYAQIPGKIRLKLAPPEPEWNHVPLYVTARGLTTSPMPYGERSFEIAFDFIMHKLVIAASDGAAKFIDLGPRSVSAFYADVMKGLSECGIEVSISDAPQEMPNPIPFARDEVHASYDREWVEKFFRALVSVDTVFKAHRAPFRGRHTPSQVWWGSLDLGYERFSGRPAQPPPGANLLYRVGADAEQINVGFWPGDDRFLEPAFFAYAYPKPEGLENAVIRPAAAFWSKELGEFLLRYEDVRRSASPADMVMEFARSTYDAAATLAHWDPALKGSS